MADNPEMTEVGGNTGNDDPKSDKPMQEVRGNTGNDNRKDDEPMQDVGGNTDDGDPKNISSANDETANEEAANDKPMADVRGDNEDDNPKNIEPTNTEPTNLGSTNDEPMADASRRERTEPDRNDNDLMDLDLPENLKAAPLVGPRYEAEDSYKARVHDFVLQYERENYEPFDLKAAEDSIEKSEALLLQHAEKMKEFELYNDASALLEQQHQKVMWQYDKDKLTEKNEMRQLQEEMTELRRQLSRSDKAQSVAGLALLSATDPHEARGTKLNHLRQGLLTYCGHILALFPGVPKPMVVRTTLNWIDDFMNSHGRLSEGKLSDPQWDDLSSFAALLIEYSKLSGLEYRPICEDVFGITNPATAPVTPGGGSSALLATQRALSTPASRTGTSNRTDLSGSLAFPGSGMSRFTGQSGRSALSHVTGESGFSTASGTPAFDTSSAISGSAPFARSMAPFGYVAGTSSQQAESSRASVRFRTPDRDDTRESLTADPRTPTGREPPPVEHRKRKADQHYTGTVGESSKAVLKQRTETGQHSTTREPAAMAEVTPERQTAASEPSQPVQPDQHLATPSTTAPGDLQRSPNRGSVVVDIQSHKVGRATTRRQRDAAIAAVPEAAQKLKIVLLVGPNDKRGLDTLTAEDQVKLRDLVFAPIYSQMKKYPHEVIFWFGNTDDCMGRYLVDRRKFDNATWKKHGRKEACGYCQSRSIPCVILDPSLDEVQVLPLPDDERGDVPPKELGYWLA